MENLNVGEGFFYQKQEILQSKNGCDNIWIELLMKNCMGGYMVTIGFFKDLKMIFCTLGLILIAFIIKLAWLDSKFSLLVGGMFLVIYALLSIRILNRITEKRLHRLHQLFFSDCNISAYIAGCEKLEQNIKYPKERKLSKSADSIQSTWVNMILVRCWLTSGYLAAGDLKKSADSIEVIQQLLSHIGYRKFPLIREFYPLQFLFALQSGNYREAEAVLNEEECTFFEDMGKSLKITDFHRTLLLLEKGSPEQALLLLPEFLSKADNRFYQVMTSWYLAKAFFLSNQPEKAWEQLHFITENGGDTFYTKKAQELLMNKGGFPLLDWERLSSNPLLQKNGWEKTYKIDIVKQYEKINQQYIKNPQPYELAQVPLEDVFLSAKAIIESFEGTCIHQFSHHRLLKLGEGCDVIEFSFFGYDAYNFPELQTIGAEVGEKVLFIGIGFDTIGDWLVGESGRIYFRNKLSNKLYLVSENIYDLLERELYKLEDVNGVSIFD